jgi:hypothetical protein
MLHFYFCTYHRGFFLSEALGLLNPNLFKFLRYHHRFSRYRKKSLIFFNSAFYSARALFKMMQLFSTSLAIKFDPDELETFCFLLLKAEIHAVLAQKLENDWKGNVSARLIPI